jgi:hypothetical protein
MKTVLLTRILYYVIPTSNICVSILSTNRDTGKTALKAKHCYLQIKASPILQSSAHVIFRRSIAGITPGPRFCLSPRFLYEYSSMVVKGVRDSCWAKAPCFTAFYLALLSLLERRILFHARLTTHQRGEFGGFWGDTWTSSTTIA